MRPEDFEKEIDHVLVRSQVWEPPVHFARTVGAQASGLVARELATREQWSVPLLSRSIARAVVLGFLVAATAYLGHVVVLAPMSGWLVSDRAAAAYDAYLRFIAQASDEWAVPVAWTSMAITLAISAWFTRGIRPFSFRLQ